ncbi:hypothetical protein SLEP1_g6708 [Rubroshorea leprosula]|uniref:Uncharacterized protein n=1 Tax=Rubroshorea leprosula TaxID=152421 RepID=A0AAV5I1Y6_9ROSI|nr:hypothetical protein SLEP1_g6708 [Rubroshorea leprosula]
MRKAKLQVANVAKDAKKAKEEIDKALSNLGSVKAKFAKLESLKISQLLKGQSLAPPFKIVVNVKWSLHKENMPLFPFILHGDDEEHDLAKGYVDWVVEMLNLEIGTSSSLPSHPLVPTIVAPTETLPSNAPTILVPIVILKDNLEDKVTIVDE